MLDMTTFVAALKSYYTNDKIEELTYQDNPLLAIMPKMEDFYGKNLPIPIIYGNPQGRSATFATAKANKTSSKITDFTLTRVKDYSLASIDNETLEASKSDKGAFLQAATVEVDGAMHSIARSLAIKMYRDGSGKVGRVGNSSFSTTTLQLADPSDITNLEVGQKIVFAASALSGALRDSGEALTIEGVDRDAGTAEVSANLSTIASITQNDFIFIQGDRQDTANPVALAISGLEAWVPDSAPGSTPFFGVDRTSDVTRLGGIRVDGSGLTIKEALIRAAVRVAREGGRPDYVFMNFADFADLEIELENKVQYVNVEAGATGTIGFRAIALNGPKGVLKVVPDQNCPQGKAYVLQMNVWKLYSLGAAPRMFTTDGLKLMREENADALEFRCLYYAQVGCRAPGWNAVVSLPESSS